MARSFSLVEAKVAEADFFLAKLEEAGTNFFAARCYFSAFIASARSITFALQAAMKDVPDFQDWYSLKQGELGADPVCRFFHHARRLDQHLGINALSGGALTSNLGEARVIYHLAAADRREGLPDPPNVDAVAACHRYFDTLLKVVLDCCSDFRRSIDPKVWFTKENFDGMGQTIGDAEEELYGVRGWTAVPGVPEEARWQMIRNSVWSADLEMLFMRQIQPGEDKGRPSD
ncbi:MAG TPA: hypothetical protein VHB47_00145 [Thermoanaerobaculia bacterium]|nr:hypothetical protein [Thermoanaerobaculia bacterium]